MVSNIPAIRAELVELLEGWLETDEGEPLHPRTRELFEIVVSGLRDLDHGQVAEIFERRKSKRRGKQPSQARRLELWALRHVAALVRNKHMKKSKARLEVATAYGRSIDLLKGWERALRAEEPSANKVFNELTFLVLMDRQMERALYGKSVVSAERVLEEASQHGAQYRKIRPGTKKADG